MQRPDCLQGRGFRASQIHHTIVRKRKGGTQPCETNELLALPMAPYRRPLDAPVCPGISRLLLAPLLLALCLAVTAPTLAAETPGGGSALIPDQRMEQAGTVTARNADLYPVTPPRGTNPAITVTLTPVDTDGGDVDLYCSRGDLPPRRDTADFVSEAIGVNQDVIFIPPVDSIDSGSPVYRCAVVHLGITLAPISYLIEVTYSFNNTSLNKAEQAVAKELFDRCCKSDMACRGWKLANDKAAKEAGVTPSHMDTNTVVETDLCQLGGVCSAGHLTQLNARGWSMKCDFPGDLFVQFPNLRALFLSWNEFTGDIQQVAKSLCSLTLEELGLYGNKLTGALDGELCGLVQQGTLEMLQLGGGNQLAGSLPACLFNAKSRLFFFGGTALGLTGGLPDSFSASSNLQILDVAENSFSGPIPASLAALPKLLRFAASNNSLTGTIPVFASGNLSVLLLDFNNLRGEVPKELISSASLIRLSVAGNAQLALPNASGGSGGLSAGAIAGICIGGKHGAPGPGS